MISLCSSSYGYKLIITQGILSLQPIFLGDLGLVLLLLNLIMTNRVMPYTPYVILRFDPQSFSVINGLIRVTYDLSIYQIIETFTG